MILFWEVSRCMQFNHQLCVPLNTKVHMEALLSKLPLLEGEVLQKVEKCCSSLEAFVPKMNSTIMPMTSMQGH